MKYTEIFPPRQAIPSRIAHRFATQYATYDNQEEQSLHTPPEARNSKLSDVNNHKFWSHSSIIYPPRKPCNPAPRGASSPLPACLKNRVLCALLTASSCTNSPSDLGPLSSTDPMGLGNSLCKFLFYFVFYFRSERLSVLCRVAPIES